MNRLALQKSDSIRLVGMSNNTDLIHQMTDGAYCSPGKGSLCTGMVNSVRQGRTHFSSGQRLQCTLHFPQLWLQCQGPRGIDRVTWQRRRRQRGDLIVQLRLLSYMRLSPHFARAYRLAHRQHKLLPAAPAYNCCTDVYFLVLCLQLLTLSKRKRPVVNRRGVRAYDNGELLTLVLSKSTRGPALRVFDKSK